MVELFPTLIHAENSEIGDVVMAARIDAPRELDAQRARHIAEPCILDGLGKGLGQGDGSGVGEIAVIQARARHDVRRQVVIGRGQPKGAKPFPEGKKIPVAHVGQDQILLRAHPKLSEAVAIHQVGEARHLRRGGIAGGPADGLQGHHHACEARALVSPAIHLKPLHKGRRPEVGDGGVLRRGGRWEETFHPIPLSFGKMEGVPRQARPAGLHLLSKGLKAQAIDENLDPRFVEIVPSSVRVVDPKHRR